jgi:uncharacterized membrane protein
MDLKHIEYLYYPALVLHIVGGALSLLSGLGAILFKKGRRNHKVSGKIFYYSMNCVAISALILSGIKESEFLFMIGVFSFYMNFMGYRSVKNKSLRPKAKDWIVVSLGFANGILMLSTGNLVLMVFSGITIFLTMSDCWAFIVVLRKKELPKAQWLSHHIGRMMGAYISTTTAFLVVNVKGFEPSWLVWLFPSIVGGPLIAYFIIKFTESKTKLST